MVDASEEDLPVEWVKRQRRDGSFYYSNTMTGAVQNSSPHERVADATGAPAATRPRRGVARMFQVSWEVDGRICCRPNNINCCRMAHLSCSRTAVVAHGTVMYFLS